MIAKSSGHYFSGYAYAFGQLHPTPISRLCSTHCEEPSSVEQFSLSVLSTARKMLLGLHSLYWPQFKEHCVCAQVISMMYLG